MGLLNIIAITGVLLALLIIYIKGVKIIIYTKDFCVEKGKDILKGYSVYMEIKYRKIKCFLLTRKKNNAQKSKRKEAGNDPGLNGIKWWIH